jgi:aminotransferase
MAHIAERESELPDSIIDLLIEVVSERPDVLSLGAGVPDFDPPAAITAALKRIGGEAGHYSSPGGIPALREAIARKVRKDNHIRADPGQVIVTCGSQEGILVAAACTLDAGEQALIPDPGFLGYLPVAELFTAAPVPYVLREEHGFEPDVDAMRRQVDPRKTKLLIINSPANPTGAVFRRSALEDIADLAIEHDLTILSDEAYEKIVYDGAKHVSIASLNGMAGRTITLQTFSKSYAMGGYRLGYAIAPPGLADAMKKARVYTTVSAPTISQLLGLTALKLPQRHITAMVREYDRRRKLIVRRLNELDLRTLMPKGAFYAFAGIQHLGVPSQRFALDLLKAKVAVVPGREFGSAGEGYIRCSYATKYGRIEAALDRMERFLARYRPRRAQSS